MLHVMLCHALLPLLLNADVLDLAVLHCHCHYLNPDVVAVEAIGACV